MLNATTHVKIDVVGYEVVKNVWLNVTVAELVEQV
jgi:hypothetical protein